MHTFKIEGCIKGEAVHFLIDKRSTLNFMAMSLVKCQRIPTSEVAPLKVALVDGSPFTCSKVTLFFEWKVGSHTFSTSFHVIPLVGYDAILGVQ